MHDAAINAICIWAHDFLMEVELIAASSTPKLPVPILIWSVAVVIVVACGLHPTSSCTDAGPLHLALVVFTFII